MTYEGRVAGKIAIITGAASGIGRATGQALAREGAAVMLADVNADEGERVAEEIRGVGGTALFQRTDVSDPSDIQSLVERAVREFGHLEVVFNNAGIMPAGTVLTTSLETWDRVMQINLRSVFLLSQAAAKAMLGGALAEDTIGSIINTASPTGLLGYPDMIDYSTSKGGIAAMTRAMAMELAPRIRVNCVVPGTTNTGILQGYLETVSNRSQVIAAFNQQHPIGRIGEPVDVALAVLYLASDEAVFITGSTLMVDGGLTMAKGNPA